LRYSANHGNTTPTNSGPNASWQLQSGCGPTGFWHAPHGHGNSRAASSHSSRACSMVAAS
jgi:hypothetical protein